MDTYSPSYSINKSHIYHVSKHSSSHYGSLIDRGANGGLAGSDVRILERTGRTVSVTGIDNHELNRNLPLSLGGVKNVMKGYCPPTSMGLPITLSPPYF